MSIGKNDFISYENSIQRTVNTLSNVCESFIRSVSPLSRPLILFFARKKIILNNLRYYTGPNYFNNRLACVSDLKINIRESMSGENKRAKKKTHRTWAHASRLKTWYNFGSLGSSIIHKIEYKWMERRKQEIIKKVVYQNPWAIIACAGERKKLPT